MKYIDRTDGQMEDRKDRKEDTFVKSGDETFPCNGRFLVLTSRTRINLHDCFYDAFIFESKG
jgi:hypothetical protein